MKYLDRWPKSGTMRNGISYRLPVLEHRTSEKGSSLWPTPTVGMVAGGQNPETGGQVGLGYAVKHWPTPTKSDGMGGPGCSGREGGKNLRTVIQRYPTPQAGANNQAAHNAMSGDFKTKLCEVWDIPVTGQLNADWVELLMGFPKGFTDLGGTDGKKGRHGSRKDKRIG